MPRHGSGAESYVEKGPQRGQSLVAPGRRLHRPVRLRSPCRLGSAIAQADLLPGSGDADCRANSWRPRRRQLDHHRDHRLRDAADGSTSCGGSARSGNPMPSRTTHNTTIEVLWTVIPVFILVRDRHPLLQAALRPIHLSAAGPDHQGHRQRLELDPRISRPGQFSVNSVMLQDNEREEAHQVRHAGRPGAAQPRGQQRGPGARQQGACTCWSRPAT